MLRHDGYIRRLAAHPALAGFERQELASLARLSDNVRLGAGRELISEGTRGRELFVLLDGEAEVSVADRVVATLRPGDHFGELALLDPAPRNATVTTTTDVEVLVVHQNALHELLVTSPTLRRRLVEGMARRIRESDLALDAKAS